MLRFVGKIILIIIVRGLGVKFTNLLTAGALMSAMTMPVAIAADANNNNGTMPDAQKKQIEQVIHDYLINNPEVLLEASQALQQKQQQAMQVQAQAAIQENASQIFNDKLAVAGNPKGNVTLVEFFDYQCIHCKKMAPVISNLVKQNPNLRVVYKEFPIFGKSSDSASRAALAAAMQGKYLAMHDALIKQENRLNDQVIMDTAKSLGLDMTKFKTDMSSQTVNDALDSNRQLAEKLHLMGTPAFIIAATSDGKLKDGSTPAFIPGAASEESLQELVKKESSNS
ncbi:27 kDa outer membrane protein [Legionella micdadei]|uniref:27 kDa outer membrane protein n=1 Tax=Legionella micdadei TaxID=451 RepID=A0A098GFI7_LEGMI|nr:27 kDa outer membrane protein [Legionella micdadei]CEG60256.1 27 kDa outer membrane protein [Legionella micdadei]SCY57715.1 Protein-disulfide isomerase [Legionella micdadei]